MDTPVDITGAIRFPGVVYGLASIVTGWFVASTVNGTLQRLGERFTHRRLLLNQLATISRFAIWFSAFFIATALSVQLSKEIVIALTGTAAVAVGFALKDLTASIIAGLIIIFDRPFQVGDRVTFAGTYGEIASIGLRSVRLVTLDDNVVTIPNSKFLTDTVASGNWGALDMLVQMDFFIGVDQDISQGKALVAHAITSSRYVFTEKPWVVLVNQVIEANYVAVRLRAKVYVLDVKHEKALETDVTERVLESFREHGVAPPAVLHRHLPSTNAVARLTS